MAKAQLQLKNDHVPSWRQAIPKCQSIEITTGEDWDQEDEVGTYNPMERIINSTTPILHNIQGKTKAEKRDFRARQRAKFIGGQKDSFHDWGNKENDNNNRWRVGSHSAGGGQGQSVDRSEETFQDFPPLVASTRRHLIRR